ncbi:MAG TPA: hypothetical protein DEO32_05835 [Ruminococcaceae bacterium]|nr:hypothetical protein [Oscillospiraceae bacterium]
MFNKIKGSYNERKKKLKGRYEQRKKQSDRKVLSYEDVPLDDYEQEKTDLSPKTVKRIILCVCAVLLAGLAVLAFANRDKLTWDNLSVWWNYDVLGNAGKGFPVNIIGSEVEARNFSVNQGRVAYASDTSFITLNNSGSEVANVQLRYSKPVMKSADNKYLTFGIGETGYQINDFEKNLFTGDAEGIIYTGDIASNGVYCLVSEGNGYFSQLCTYDKNNNRIFKYSFSEYYITSVALNGDGSRCVVCGMTSDNGVVKTGIYVLDFKHDKPVKQHEISGDTVMDCKYIGSDRSVFIGEKNAYVVTDGSDDFKTVSYNDKLLVNYCFSPATNSFVLALSKSGDGRSCTLIRYNNGGGEILTVDNPYGAESVSVFKGTIAVLDGNMLYSYDGSGKLAFSGDAGTGARSFILTGDNRAFVMSVNQIRQIELERHNPDSSGDSA